MKKIVFKNILSIVFVFFLFVGLIGMFSSYENQFKELSFFNLVATFGLVFLSFRKEINLFSKVFGIIFLIGFLSELIGVHSGLIFGNYYYQNNLGFKLFEVPIVIGINWAILSIGAWNLSDFFSQNKLNRIIIGSILMVIFDFIMEPAAIHLNFWQWKSVHVPLLNYFSWFAVSLPAIYICSLSKLKSSGITKTVFVAQFLFFFILSIKFLWF